MEKKAYQKVYAERGALGDKENSDPRGASQGRRLNQYSAKKEEAITLPPPNEKSVGKRGEGKRDRLPSL